MPSPRDTFRRLGLTLWLVFRASPTMTLAMAGATVFAAVVPVLMVAVGKQIVDAVVARQGGEATFWVAVELFAALLGSTSNRAVELVRSLLARRLGIDVMLRILRSAVGMDVSRFEDSEFYDSLVRARCEASDRPVAFVADSFQLLQHATTLCGYGVLLLQYDLAIVLLLAAATVPATLCEIRFSKRLFRLHSDRAHDVRRQAYLEHVLASDECVKELRTFGLADLFLGRYRALTERFYHEDRRFLIRSNGAAHLLSFLATTAYYGTYATMAAAAAFGTLTLGQMTLYMMTFRNGQLSFQNLLKLLGTLYEHDLHIDNIFRFVLHPDGPGPKPLDPTREVRRHVPPSGELGFLLEDLGFRYPRNRDFALRHVNLLIPQNAIVAVVGRNGSGKTTLIKLLCGLYSPTEGRILLDGRDLSEWHPESLRNRMSVLFQDFVQYQLTMRENVGLGSVQHLDDPVRIEAALGGAGAAPILAGLSSGLDTQLGHWFDGGRELSAGQWQKVALARSFLREEADILLLDEPTASLDAEAEGEMTERFRTLTRGRTAVIVSHRFPTVRIADSILVVDKGRVVEQGSHENLMARNELYSRMFTQQARSYR